MLLDEIDIDSFQSIELFLRVKRGKGMYLVERANMCLKTTELELCDDSRLNEMGLKFVKGSVSKEKEEKEKNTHNMIVEANRIEWVE